MTERKKWQTDHLSALSELIQYDKWAGCGIADGSRDLVKVYREGRQVGRNAFSCPHACEYLVDNTNLCCVRWHVAANVSHEHDQTNLGHKSATVTLFK